MLPAALPVREIQHGLDAAVHRDVSQRAALPLLLVSEYVVDPLLESV